LRKFKHEDDFKDWAVKELRKLPHVWVYATWVGPRRGIPDILGFVAGEGLALELKLDDKATDKTRETLQAHNISQIKNAGINLAMTRLTPSQWKSFMIIIKMKIAKYKKKIT